jgi:hypothetical protein
MAAGAILPPMFFERRLVSYSLRAWHFQEHPETTQRCQRNSTAGVISAGHPAIKSLPKEI